MQKHKYIAIYEPLDTQDWFILETDQSFFELRLGGLKKIEKPNTGNVIHLTIEPQDILGIKTDDFSVYIELENGCCIVHSDTFINHEGETSFEIRIWDKERFAKEKADWYDPDKELIEIKMEEY